MDPACYLRPAGRIATIAAGREQLVLWCSDCGNLSWWSEISVREAMHRSMAHLIVTHSVGPGARV